MFRSFADRHHPRVMPHGGRMGPISCDIRAHRRQRRPPSPSQRKRRPRPRPPPSSRLRETGPCRLGVISALGDRFSVQKFGLTIFENEENEAADRTDGGSTISPFARVRAATGARSFGSTDRLSDGSVSNPIYNPKSTLSARSKRGLAGDRQEHHRQRKLRTLSGHHEVQRGGAGHQYGDQGHRRVQSGHRIVRQAFPSVRQCCGQHVSTAPTL